MDWCCDEFRLYNRARGARGISLHAAVDPDLGPYFVLEFRSVSQDDLEKLPHRQVAITLVQDLRISFCPFCGSDLGRHYGSALPEMLRQST